MYSITHSITHAPSLSDALGTEALALWKNPKSIQKPKLKAQAKPTDPSSSVRTAHMNVLMMWHNGSTQK